MQRFAVIKDQCLGYFLLPSKKDYVVYAKKYEAEPTDWKDIDKNAEISITSPSQGGLDWVRKQQWSPKKSKKLVRQELVEYAEYEGNRYQIEVMNANRLKKYLSSIESVAKKFPKDPQKYWRI